MAILNNKEYHWSTYYDEAVSVTADESTNVYTAKLNDAGTALELIVVPDRVIPAGNAVILRSENETVNLTLNEEAAGTLPDNELRGSYTKIETSSIGGTVYTLAAENGKLSFYKYIGETLAARKAFLVADAAIRSIDICYNDDITTVNGIVTTIESNASYDLNGCRIQPAKRGLYISRGKKYVKK